MCDIGIPFEPKHKFITPNGARDYPELKRRVWVNNGKAAAIYDGNEWIFENDEDYPTQISADEITCWEYNRD